jgi:hypothetical protein
MKIKEFRLMLCSISLFIIINGCDLGNKVYTSVSIINQTNNKVEMYILNSRYNPDQTGILYVAEPTETLFEQSVGGFTETSIGTMLGGDSVILITDTDTIRYARFDWSAPPSGFDIFDKADYDTIGVNSYQMVFTEDMYR